MCIVYFLSVSMLLHESDWHSIEFTLTFELIYSLTSTYFKIDIIERNPSHFVKNSCQFVEYKPETPKAGLIHISVTIHATQWKGHFKDHSVSFNS